MIAEVIASQRALADRLRWEPTDEVARMALYDLLLDGAMLDEEPRLFRMPPAFRTNWLRSYRPHGRGYAGNSRVMDEMNSLARRWLDLEDLIHYFWATSLGGQNLLMLQVRDDTPVREAQRALLFFCVVVPGMSFARLPHDNGDLLYGLFCTGRNSVPQVAFQRYGSWRKYSPGLTRLLDIDCDPPAWLESSESWANAAMLVRARRAAQRYAEQWF